MRIGHGGKNLRPVSTGGSTPASLGGAGTLAAPTLGYPSPIASNPTTIAVSIPGDWQAGVDAIKLARSASLAMTSPTILRYPATVGTYLSDADVAAGTISIGLSGLTLSGATYFQAYGEHLGTDSAFLSNIVEWGDTTAPTITTASTASNVETTALAIALTGTDTSGIASWAIAGGPDQLLFEISGTTLRWFGNGSQSYGAPLDQGGDNVYNVTVSATDYGGNTSTLGIAVTVTVADTSPNAFSFTDVSGVTASTLQTSNTVTMAGIGTGINAPATVTGGSYSKNGGAFVTTSPFTLANGDTVALQATSSATAGAAVNVTLSVGSASPGSGVVSDTYTITTFGVSNQLDTTINPTIFTYSNGNKTAKNTNGSGNKLAFSQATYSSGKLYWEVTVDTGSSATGHGIVDASGASATFPGDTHSSSYAATGNFWFNNAITHGGLATYTTGDRLAFAFDATNKLFWVGKFVAGSVVWQFGSPSAGTGGQSTSAFTNPVQAMISPGGLNNQATLCLSAADQLGTPPTSFSAAA